MNDERREGGDLLNPEGHAEVRETGFEQPENTPQLERPRGDAPRVDQRQLQAMKSTITPETRSMPEKDQVLSDIENMLAENLGEIYQQLPEHKRAAFKKKGEEVAATIQQMIVTAKIKVHHVLKLISDWLGMIPNVNVYFLRQEAKIKLDKVMDYVEERANTSQNAV